MKSKKLLTQIIATLKLIGFVDISTETPLTLLNPTILLSYKPKSINRLVIDFNTGTRRNRYNLRVCNYTPGVSDVTHSGSVSTKSLRYILNLIEELEA